MMCRIRLEFIRTKKRPGPAGSGNSAPAADYKGRTSLLANQIPSARYEQFSGMQGFF